MSVRKSGINEIGRGEKGETLVMVVISLAIMCLIMDAVVSSIAVQVRAQRDMDVASEVRTLSSSIGGVFAAPAVCGAMIDQNVPLSMADAQAASGAALRMTLPGGSLVEEGATVAGLPLRVRSFRFSDARFIGLQPSGVAAYLGRLSVGFERTDNQRHLKTRDVGLVTIFTTATGSPQESIRGCAARPTEDAAQSVCASMGGVYDLTANSCGCGEQSVVSASGSSLDLPRAANGEMNTQLVMGTLQVSHLCVSGKWAKIFDQTSPPPGQTTAGQ